MSGLLSATPAASATAVATWVDWDRQTDAPQTHRVGAFTLTTEVRRAVPEVSTPVLTIRSKGRRTLTLVGAEGLSSVYASVLVFPATRPHGQSVILFRSYSGGAHCCQVYRLIEPTAAGWRVRPAGSWDGGGPEPQDVDGDGKLELVAYDQRFDYRMTSHAESVMPPVVYEVRDGKLADVSTELRFKPLFQDRLQELREACEKSESPIGPCLGYVAVAARAGDARRALAVLDRKPVDPADHRWPVPGRCGGTPLGCAHEEPEKVLTSRHEAVVYFLTDVGYLPRGAK